MLLPPVTPDRARRIAAGFACAHIVVIGDAMIDKFIVGRVTRISPEAPVPVVRFQSEHVRLGGAANVAHNLSALGAKVSLIGIIGRDLGALRAQVRGDGRHRGVLDGGG